MKARGAAIFAFILLVVFIVVVGQGRGYPRKARMLPFVVGIPGIVLAATTFIRELTKSKEPPPTKEEEVDGTGPWVALEKTKFLMMIGWVVLLIGMIWVFGFLIATPAYVFLFLKARREKWLLSISFAAASWAFLYGIFAVALKIFLYPGILFK